MKTLYIIRGVPGSGKSSLGRTLCPAHNVANDDFMLDPETGKYAHDPKRMPEVIAKCEDRILRWMKVSVPTMAVANVFMHPDHIREYREMAEEYGYSVFEIVCNNDFGNVHDVPEDVLARMRKYFHYRPFVVKRPALSLWARIKKCVDILRGRK